MATMDKREMADEEVRDNRNRNDELTAERRYKEDKTLEDHRIRNDLLTADRREVKDDKRNMALAIGLSLLIVLAIGIFSIFI